MKTLFSKLTLEGVKHYILEMLIGLRYLKSLGILHRDIRPQNFLYNPETKKGAIIDLGLAELALNYI